MIGAEELARRAIGISSDMADLGHARARAGRCLVRIERRHHRLDSAIEHANRALASAESVNDQPERIRILQEKAVVLAMNELPVEAAAMSEAALDACGSPDVDGASLRPGVRWSRGTVLLHARRYREAAVVLAAGKREAEEQGQPRMCAWIDLVSAHVAFETCDYDAGERYATAAMDVFTGLRHRYGTAHCRYQLGQISLARGRLEADRSLREALETFHSCADSWIEGEVSLVLAEAYRRQGQVRAAIGLQLKARRSYHRMNGQAQARQATRELIRTLLTGPPARLRMLWSANSRPDGA
jgi:tetratricopeptide (TPR) repeat protein